MKLSKSLILGAVLLGLVALIALVIEWLPRDPPKEISNERYSQWELPKKLREASGLARINDQELLIHNDEKGIIYRINIETHKVSVFARLGKPAPDHDYEGIAIARAFSGETADVYLVTSKGVLHRIKDIPLAATAVQTEAELIDTGLGKFCEIEGLAYEKGMLLLPCKTALTDEFQDRLVIFSFDIESGTTGVYLNLPNEDIGLKKAQPTAIEIDSENYYVVIPGAGLLVIDRTSLKTRRFSLPKKRHFQPEGIALLEDGSFIVVDDIRKGRGRLTHYYSLSSLKEKRVKAGKASQLKTQP